MQRLIKDWPPERTFEIAPEPKLQLRSVKRWRRQLAAKRLNIEHRKDVARYAKDFVKRLAKPLHRCEAVDSFHSGGTRHRGVVYVLLKAQRQFIG